jgi:hypothetical protein
MSQDLTHLRTNDVPHQVMPSSAFLLSMSTEYVGRFTAESGAQLPFECICYQDYHSLFDITRILKTHGRYKISLIFRDTLEESLYGIATSYW